MNVQRRLPAVPRPYRGLVRRSVAAAAALAVVVVAVPVAEHSGPDRLGDVQRVADDGAPTGVVVTAPTEGRKLTVRWNAVSGATRYTVYVYSGTNPGSGTAVASGTTSYTASGLTNGTRYNVVVSATKTTILFPGEYKADAVTGTPADVAPATPTGLSASPADRQVTLTWTASSEPDLLRYEIVDATSGSVLRQVSAGTTSATFSGLVNGADYSVGIRAVDTANHVSALSASVLTSARDAVAPGVPRKWTVGVEDGAADFSWAAPSDNDVEEYVLLDGTGAVVTTVPASSTRTVLDGLVNGRSYSFSLEARDTSGNLSAATALITVVPRDSFAPAAPRSLTATVEDRRTTLSWTAPADTDLARYEVLDARGAVVATVDATSRTAVVSGLTNRTAYTFSVRAVDTSGNTGTASTPVAVTPRDSLAPAAPTDLAATAGDGAATLTWTAPLDADLVRYEVLDSTGRVVTTVPAGTTTAVVSGLVDGVPQTFSVRAVDTSGNTGTASTPVAVTPRDSLAPAAPTDVTATGADRSVVVSWTAPADTDLASYRVLAADGAVLATVPVGTTTTTVTGLVNGVPVTVAVTATDTSGNTSPAGGPVAVTPRDADAPASPTAVTATSEQGAATLSWTPPADADLAGYEVRTSDGTLLASLPASATGGRVTGLVDGTAYDLVVVAVDTSGNTSAPSAVVRVTPQGAPQVTGLLASAGDTVVGLTWAAVAGAGGYEVLQDGIVVASVASPSASITGLVDGQTYSFAVRAVATSGSPGALSVAVTATPVRRSSGATTQTGAGGSGFAVSRDGRFVVLSTADRLEASDTNSVAELHLVDRLTGTARRLAPQPGSATTANPVQSAAAAVSADGRYVVVATTQKLVAGDSNTLPDVYRFDTVSDAWQLVSVPAAGTTSASVAGTVLQTGSSVYTASPSVAVTADGQRVFFYSARADLVAGDTNGSVDLFVKDMESGTVSRVSTTASGTNIAKVVTGPALAVTPDGRFAVFPAAASNGPMTVLRKDLQTGELVTVSAVVRAGATTEFGVFRDAGDLAVSDDGRFVVLSTAQKVLTSTPAASFSTGLAYRKDVQTGELLALGSGQSGAWEHRLAIDPSGRYGFYSTISADVAADRNLHTDVYRRDLQTGAVVLVTSAADGSATPTAVNGSVDPKEYGFVVALSADQVVVSTLQAMDPLDANKAIDTHLKDVGTGVVSNVVAR